LLYIKFPVIKKERKIDAFVCIAEHINKTSICAGSQFFFFCFFVLVD
jgi:hypothetical protein